ncbi:cyanate lyase C-terminal domain-containing protein [Abortiporus biennis]|nr:cyanate lyase C-terminal domain-containing protein [Abortiporus biennis]
MASALKLNSTSEPFSKLPSICTALFEAKAAKGLTFEQIGEAIGRNEVWVASAFYAQAKLSKDELNALAQTLDIDQSSLNAELGEHWFPRRSIGPAIPTDLVIYRLYEGVMVYGNSIKAVIHEKFGDGIMSMIDCEVDIQKKPTDKGEHVVLTFEGKYLPYKKW